MAHKPQEDSLQTFAAVRERWPWKAITNCPGRFILDRRHARLPLSQLLGMPVPVTRFQSAHARDPILVAKLEGGGVISYVQPDGRLIHTLNTPEGLSRKLQQLGLTLDNNTEGSNGPDGQ